VTEWQCLENKLNTNARGEIAGEFVLGDLDNESRDDFLSKVGGKVYKNSGHQLSTSGVV
jgi:hypothetical protein